MRIICSVIFLLVAASIWEWIASHKRYIDESIDPSVFDLMDCDE